MVFYREAVIFIKFILVIFSLVIWKEHTYEKYLALLLRFSDNMQIFSIALLLNEYLTWKIPILLLFYLMCFGINQNHPCLYFYCVSM